ncbi:DNA repair protein RadC [uncultured Halopseudomonas sp.]|uniref:RadC family protein n=1 Tax=uncultured Halopseudomonas sp. TaxID=2901193 RepID=UPI0030EC9503|tara:strand:- start:7880 stop:8368 length:489 start_codon:yes stop_codon:yes gene_type:complete
MQKIATQAAIAPPAGIPLSEKEVLSWAQSILETRFKRSNYLTSPQHVKNYLMAKLAAEEREVFGIILLDSQHGVLGFEILFHGTIDSASVYPREVIKSVLNANAACVILTHNHPSGRPEPSSADVALTKRLQTALDTIEVRVLDHLVIGGADSVSFAERGLL